MRRTILAVALMTACSGAPSNAEPVSVPEQAAMLAVAKCVESVDGTAQYDQALRPVGDLKLFADTALAGALGGIEARDVVYGRKVSDGVWAILVADFDKRVCEAYISEENAELVGNEPGPDPQ